MLCWQEKRVFLADFGTSKNFPVSVCLNGAYVTKEYLPPELFGGKAPPRLLLPSVDMWSLGALLFEVRTGVFLCQPDRVCKDVTEYCQDQNQSSRPFSRTRWGRILGQAGDSVARTVYRLCKGNPYDRPAASNDAANTLHIWANSRM